MDNTTIEKIRELGMKVRENVEKVVYEPTKPMITAVPIAERHRQIQVNQ